jgi:hypothetical protein
MPSVSWSPGGGLDISITFGIGIYKALSAQTTIGYSFGNDNFYIQNGASYLGITAYYGWGTKSGNYAGIGYSIFSGSGLSSNIGSIGINYSENGGWSANISSVQVNSQGEYSLDPSISYSYSIDNSKQIRVEQRNRSNFEAIIELANYDASNDGERPDADGYITFFEARYWWRNGHGKPLFVDISQINLGRISSKNFPDGPGSSIVYNLLTNSNSINDGLVHGKVVLTLYNSESLGSTAYYIMADPEKYDFDYKSWNNHKNWGRNTENFIGSVVAGYGTPYVMRFYGRQYIPYKSSIFSNTWVK